MKQEIKVGDHVHVGHMVKGGAGYRGVVQKIEDDGSIMFKSHSENRTFKGKLQNTTIEKMVGARNESTDEVNEISKKVAGNYYQAVVKKHIAKVGIKPKMYDRMEKDIGKKHKDGIDRAMTRLTKEDIEEQAPVAPSLGVHRIAVTTSEPDHPAVSQRKEKTQRFVKVTTNSKDRAIEQAKKHFSRKGYKVHGAEHHSMVHEDTNTEEVEELEELSKDTLKSYSKKAYDEMHANRVKAGQAALAAKVSADVHKDKYKIAAQKAMNVARKRMAGLTKASFKVQPYGGVKEDAVELEELTNKTLNNYTDAANKDFEQAKQSGDSSKMLKRGTGLMNAVIKKIKNTTNKVNSVAESKEEPTEKVNTESE